MRFLERLKARVDLAKKEAKDVRDQLKMGLPPGEVVEDSVKRAFGKK